MKSLNIFCVLFLCSFSIANCQLLDIQSIDNLEECRISIFEVNQCGDFFLVNEENELYISEDEGASWERVPWIFSSDISGIQFFSDCQVLISTERDIFLLVDQNTWCQKLESADIAKIHNDSIFITQENKIYVSPDKFNFELLDTLAKAPDLFDVSDESLVWSERHQVFISNKSSLKKDTLSLGNWNIPKYLHVTTQGGIFYFIYRDHRPMDGHVESKFKYTHDTNFGNFPFRTVNLPCIEDFSFLDLQDSFYFFYDYSKIQKFSDFNEFRIVPQEINSVNYFGKLTGSVGNTYCYNSRQIMKININNPEETTEIKIDSSLYKQYNINECLVISNGAAMVITDNDYYVYNADNRSLKKVDIGCEDILDYDHDNVNYFYLFGTNHFYVIDKFGEVFEKHAHSLAETGTNLPYDLQFDAWATLHPMKYNNLKVFGEKLMFLGGRSCGGGIHFSYSERSCRVSGNRGKSWGGNDFLYTSLGHDMGITGGHWTWTLPLKKGTYRQVNDTVYYYNNLSNGELGYFECCTTQHVPFDMHGTSLLVSEDLWHFNEPQGALNLSYYSNDLGKTFNFIGECPNGSIHKAFGDEATYVLTNDDRLFKRDSLFQDYIELDLSTLGGLQNQHWRSFKTDSLGRIYIHTNKLNIIEDIPSFEQFVNIKLEVDDNQNCMLENEELDSNNETLFLNWKAQISDDKLNFFYSNDCLSFGARPGNYLLNIKPPNDLWEICENDITLNLQNNDTLEFTIPIYPKIECAALQLTSEFSTIRFCEPFNVQLIVDNINGTQNANNIEIIIEHDAYSELLSSDYPYEIIDENSFAIYIDEMYYQERKIIDFEFMSSCDVPENFVHCFNTYYECDNRCDFMEGSNSNAKYQPIVAAYDPNDITAFNEAGFEVDKFDIDDYQIFRVRFQNTGNSFARNIKVITNISNKLDLKTLEFISSSHISTFEINDFQQLVVSFADINLTFQDDNEALSNGYFYYKIKPLSDVLSTSFFTSYASIFFDFNEPILTNYKNTRLINENFQYLGEVLKCEEDDPMDTLVAGIYVNQEDGDSFDTPYFELVIVGAEETMIDTIICKGNNVNGYETTGFYVDNLVSYRGCDSTVFLNLVVVDDYNYNIDVEICEGESYNGHQTTGEYEDHFTASSGCDSTIFLNLIVNENDFIIIDTTICEGEDFFGFTESGAYFINDQNSVGCDSITGINISVLPIENENCISSTFELNYGKPVIYPNPVIDFFYILFQTESLDNLTFHLKSIHGVTIQTGIIKEKNTLVSTEGLSSGLYFLQFNSLDQKALYKIFIE